MKVKTHMSKYVVTAVLTLALTMGMAGPGARAAEENVETSAEQTQISFTPWYSIKLGENLHKKFQYHNAPLGVVPAVIFSEEDGKKFFGHDWGGYEAIDSADGPVDVAHQITNVQIENKPDRTMLLLSGIAINPGTVQAQCYENRDIIHDVLDGVLPDTDMPAPVATYPVLIEEPVIETDLDEEYYIDEVFSFGTNLRNTAFTEGLIEDKINNWQPKDPAITYQANVEIVEGADCVTLSEEDYSQALAGSGTLEFKKAGTVKLKITYQPVELDDGILNYLDNADNIYIPEKTITLNVVDPWAELQSALKEVQNLRSLKDAFTPESWERFEKAIVEAERIVGNPDATLEDYIRVFEELENAADALVEKGGTKIPKNPEPKTPKGPEPAKPTTVNTQNTAPATKPEVKSKAPQTGDTSKPILFIGLLAISLLCISSIAVKRFLKKSK